MLHLPVDHRLRGFYRALSVLTGLALTVFGVVAYIKVSDLEMFEQKGERVLGLTANPAFALGCIAVGIIVVLCTVVGRNVDVIVNGHIGVLLMLVGLAAIAVLRTSANYLAFSITNVNTMFVLGTILLTAGMYSGVSRQR